MTQELLELREPAVQRVTVDPIAPPRACDGELDVDRRVYPETMKQLDAADEALGKKQFDQALELVRKGRPEGA